MGWLPGSGCVLWLQMDERQGSTAYDLSDKGNHGTIYGATWGRGNIGYCLNFDGVDDYVDCGGRPELNLDGMSYTLEVWVKPKKKDVHQGFISKRGASEQDQWLHFGFRNTNEITVDHFWDGLNVTYDWVPNRWYHIVARYDATVREQRIFVNGVSVGARTAIGDLVNTNGRSLWVGRLHLGVWPFAGLIDEVRIYNRPLGAEEIKAHYWYGVIPALRPV